jgi:16S rRNA (cytidine1402-2'-O)-methyltransferase
MQSFMSKKASAPSQNPVLFFVSTPIGNLADITLRAIDTLKEVDFVVSEDTRKTGFLLNHFEIKKPQLAFNEYNERKQLPKIMEMLHEGKKIALVTDAGTPGISDPGYLLVQAALEEGFEFTAIPGASAVTMALLLSGLPSHSFTFKGFSPRKSGPRKRFLGIDTEMPHTLIFYESPYRLISFLEDALEVYGDRDAAVANDLTKLFEQVDRGTISELITRYQEKAPKGEYTVAIAGKRE